MTACIKVEVISHSSQLIPSKFLEQLAKYEPAFSVLQPFDVPAGSQ